MLFAIELDRRLHEFGVHACALHPGAIHTGLARHLTPESTQAMMQRIAAWSTAPPLTFKTITQGAATQVWAGVVANAAEVAGRYCEDCAVASVNDDPASAHGVRSYALDPLRAHCGQPANCGFHSGSRRARELIGSAPLAASCLTR